MPTKSIIVYITEDNTTPKSAYAIISISSWERKANDRRTAIIQARNIVRSWL